MATTNDLKNGMVLNLDGQLWTVIEFQHVKPGKGGAFVRTKLKNVLSGKVVDKTFNAGVKVETATVDKRDMTVPLQATATTSSSWTPTPTTSSTSRPTTVGDAANYLLENQTAIVAVNDGVPLYVELPGRRSSWSSRTPSRACRATAPPAAPSRPRWRPAPRSRCRCSSPPARRSRSTPATAGTSAASAEPRHAHGRSHARPASARSTSSSRPSCAATTRSRRCADRRRDRRRPAGAPTTPSTLVEGVGAHRDRIDELLAELRRGLDARPDARRRPRPSCGSASSSCCDVDDVAGRGGGHRGGGAGARRCRPTTRRAFVNGVLGRIADIAEHLRATR